MLKLEEEDFEACSSLHQILHHVETVTGTPTLCFSRLGSWYFSPLDEGRWKLGIGWQQSAAPGLADAGSVSILRYILHIFCTCSNLKLSNHLFIWIPPSMGPCECRFSSCKEQVWISQLQIEWFSWSFSCILGRCSEFLPLSKVVKLLHYYLKSQWFFNRLIISQYVHEVLILAEDRITISFLHESNFTNSTQ